MKFNHELGTNLKQLMNSSDFSIYAEVFQRLKTFSIISLNSVIPLISIAQCVNSTASLTFCPLLPIASVN